MEALKKTFTGKRSSSEATEGRPHLRRRRKPTNRRETTLIGLRLFYSASMKKLLIQVASATGHGVRGGL